jgi:predicted transcriptional regulator of viral defense system
VAIQEFLSTRQVFTAEDFAARFSGSQTDRNLLTRAVAKGGVDKVRRGVYVSKVGRFAGAAIDPLDVALAVAADAVFCYNTALRLLGTAHNLTRQVQFFTASVTKVFTYDGVDYVPCRARGARLAPQSILTSAGRSYQATGKEQTLIDCLADISAAGGPDNLLHSLASLTRLDAALAVEVAARASHSARARLGWTLEAKRDDWRVPDTILATLADSLGVGPYYFWSAAARKDRYWVKRWRLFLSHPEQEMAAWLTS